MRWTFLLWLAAGCAAGVDTAALGSPSELRPPPEEGVDPDVDADESRPEASPRRR
jgi:hypothetical protein